MSDQDAYNNMYEEGCDYEKVDTLNNQINILQSMIRMLKICDIDYKDIIVNAKHELYKTIILS